MITILQNIFYAYAISVVITAIIGKIYNLYVKKGYIKEEVIGTVWIFIPIINLFMILGCSVSVLLGSRTLKWFSEWFECK